MLNALLGSLLGCALAVFCCLAWILLASSCMPGLLSGSVGARTGAPIDVHFLLALKHVNMCWVDLFVCLYSSHEPCPASLSHSASFTFLVLFSFLPVLCSAEGAP